LLRGEDAGENSSGSSTRQYSSVGSTGSTRGQLTGIYVDEHLYILIAALEGPLLGACCLRKGEVYQTAA
jgi:hypothetical protein